MYASDTPMRRMPIGAQPSGDFQEVEADAFGVAFMMPRWLIGWHAERQDWTVEAFRRPEIVYQLALRIGDAQFLVKRFRADDIEQRKADIAQRGDITIHRWIPVAISAACHPARGPGSTRFRK